MERPEAGKNRQRLPAGAEELEGASRRDRQGKGGEDNPGCPEHNTCRRDSATKPVAPGAEVLRPGNNPGNRLQERDRPHVPGCGGCRVKDKGAEKGCGGSEKEEGKDTAGTSRSAGARLKTVRRVQRRGCCRAFP